MFAVNPVVCKHLVEQFNDSIKVSVVKNVDISSQCCNVCKDPSENWICLYCGIISCSRHVNGHAGDHYEETKHPVSASFSDGSFWCYSCDTYVYERTCLKEINDILNFDTTTTTATTNEKDSNSNSIDDQVVPSLASDKNNSTTTTSNVNIETEAVGSAVKINDNITTTNDKDDVDDEEYSDESSSEGEESLSLIQRMKEMIFGVGKGPKIVDPAVEPTIVEDTNILKKPTIEEIAKYIKSGKCKNIIVMTGAGISVAAGIPDFRSPKIGLYDKLEQYNLPYKEAIFEIEFFKQNPKPFFVLSKELFPGSFKPTNVHYFIKLLNDKGLLLRNFTQNIDTLERIAGVPNNKLVEAHGSFATSRCVVCKTSHSTEYVKEKILGDEIPYCKDSKCGGIDNNTKGIVKPDIVFFGESLPMRFNDCAREDFPKCDLLIVIGTSLKVHPFASLINFAKDIPRVLINFEEVGTNPYGGFKFNDPNNKLDVKCIGDCQELTKDFIKLLGWEDEFNQLKNSST